MIGQEEVAGFGVGTDMAQEQAQAGQSAVSEAEEKK